MDALFVNLFVIILILILYPRQHSTILYVINGTKGVPHTRKGDTLWIANWMTSSSTSRGLSWR